MDKTPMVVLLVVMGVLTWLLWQDLVNPLVCVEQHTEQVQRCLEPNGSWGGCAAWGEPRLEMVCTKRARVK